MRWSRLCRCDGGGGGSTRTILGPGLFENVTVVEVRPSAPVRVVVVRVTWDLRASRTSRSVSTTTACVGTKVRRRGGGTGSSASFHSARRGRYRFGVDAISRSTTGVVAFVLSTARFPVLSGLTFGDFFLRGTETTVGGGGGGGGGGASCSVRTINGRPVTGVGGGVATVSVGIEVGFGAVTAWELAERACKNARSFATTSGNSGGSFGIGAAATVGAEFFTGGFCSACMVALSSSPVTGKPWRI